MVSNYKKERIESWNKSKKRRLKIARIYCAGGYKKSLRIFFTLGIATTLAFGLTGCGNSEAPAEEAEVTEEVETEENNTQEIIGEDSTDTLTIDELLAGIGSDDILDAFDNQKALDLIANWMEQNGYHVINTEFVAEAPICDAYSVLRSDGSLINVRIELSLGYGGVYNIYVTDKDDERINTFQMNELPSALKLNELIEEN